MKSSAIDLILIERMSDTTAKSDTIDHVMLRDTTVKNGANVRITMVRDTNTTSVVVTVVGDTNTKSAIVTVSDTNVNVLQVTARVPSTQEAQTLDTAIKMINISTVDHPKRPGVRRIRIKLTPTSPDVRRSDGRLLHPQTPKFIGAVVDTISSDPRGVSIATLLLNIFKTLNRLKFYPKQ